MPTSYGLSEDDGTLDRTRDMVLGHEGNIGRIYLDSLGIPTIGVGISLADKNRKPWSDLNERLRGQGINPDAPGPGGIKTMGQEVWDAIEAYKGGNKSAGFEQPRYTKDRTPVFRNPPPLGVTVTAEQGVADVMPVLDKEAEKVRNKLGQDASGGFVFDNLQPGERAGLVDAYHHAPGLIGRGLIGVLRNRDDPAWRDKAWWELAMNVQNPDKRSLDEGNQFTRNSFLKSPVDNLFNSSGYARDLLEKTGDAVRRGLEAGAVGATSSAGIPAPNMLNANSTPANMLNASPEELRRAGY